MVDAVTPLFAWPVLMGHAPSPSFALLAVYLPSTVRGQTAGGQPVTAKNSACAREHVHEGWVPVNFCQLLYAYVRQEIWRDQGGRPSRPPDRLRTPVEARNPWWRPCCQEG